ncbi:QRFP-like peptide receptor isoform X2 [Parasteatoda tepidariorum]|uniref:QRFP-like peptide receptor isoform X2 n=1 Tax=Parasteatoda tepidariorum TaxID=114398 RepID=UPI00077FB6E4|nr:QRFP-like peptide receptor isoform X2 [Parasteatoda tepidariorum]
MSLNDTLCEEDLQSFKNMPLPSYENHTYFREPYIFKTLIVTDYFKIVAYVFIILGGILGNISIILTVALNRSMRTTINYYVANLAVADALICIFCMGPHFINTLTYPVFALGEFMCKFNPFTQMVCLTTSVLTLSAISCDRFVAIMFPLHVRITKQRTSNVMAIIWIISSVVSIPFLIVKQHNVFEFQNFMESRCSERWPLATYYSKDTGACEVYYKYQFSYYLTVSITLYFLPVFLMITAYSLILWKLWISEVPGERNTQNINVQYRARKKVIKMVFVVLLAFIMCWTPFEALVLLQTFPEQFQAFIHYMNNYFAISVPVEENEKHISFNKEPEWLENFKWLAYFFAYANSFINPIIYGGFNKTFRDGFCLVLKCGFRRNGFNRPRQEKNIIGSNSQRTSLFHKTLRSMYTSLTLLRSRTQSQTNHSKTQVPTYQAKLVKATAV